MLRFLVYAALLTTIIMLALVFIPGCSMAPAVISAVSGAGGSKGITTEAQIGKNNERNLFKADKDNSLNIKENNGTSAGENINNNLKTSEEYSEKDHQDAKTIGVNINLLITTQDR